MHMQQQLLAHRTHLVAKLGIWGHRLGTRRPNNGPNTTTIVHFGSNLGPNGPRHLTFENNKKGRFQVSSARAVWAPFWLRLGSKGHQNITLELSLAPEWLPDRPN